MFKKVLIFSLLSWLFPAFLYGQQPVPTLEEVVVTATRTEVPMERIGNAVTVITEEDIKRRGATDLSELLREVPGFMVSGTGSRGGLTELYSRGGESNFMLVLIDGMEVNQGGGDFDFSTLTTDNIERIEIVRGPQSALYGSEAIGGVINIITKRGAGKLSGGISTAHGVHSENGHYKGEQKTYFSGETDNFDYSFGYGRIDDHGILDTNNRFSSNVFSGRLSLISLEDLDITFTIRHEDTSFGLPTEVGGDRFDRVFPGLDPRQENSNHNTVGTAKTVFYAKPWWEHELQVGVSHRENDWDDPADPAFDAFDFASFFSETKERRFTIDYHNNFTFSPHPSISTVLTVGFEYEKEDYQYSDNFFNNFSDDRNNKAIYGQGQIGLWKRLFLTGGVRYEDNSQFGQEVNPRGSLAYLFKQTGTKLRAAIGKGIKEPTFLETRGFGLFVVGNPALDPERSFSWEVGIDQNLWNGKVELGATYFKNSFDDLIAFSAAAFPNGTNYANIQEAESYGLEFSFKATPGFGLTIGGSYTFLQTEVTNDGGGVGGIFFAQGRSLLRRPEHTFSFYVQWLWQGLNVHLRGLYVGKRDDSLIQAPPPFGFPLLSQRVTNEDYLKMDLTASYELPVRFPFLKGLKVFVKAENLLNQHYEEVFGYSSPKASFLGGLSFTF